MNKLATAGFLCAALLTACGQTTLSQDTNSATAKVLSAQAASTGTVTCPPYYKLCGNYTLAARPPVPGNIIPADFIFTGTYDIYQNLGQSFNVQFPSSGYTKFYVNNLLLTVGDLDKTFYDKKATFKLVSTKKLGTNKYEFSYYAEMQGY